MEQILKRVRFQIGEPRTAQDVSRTCALSILSSAVRMGVGKWGVSQLSTGDHDHRISEFRVCFPVYSWSFSPTGSAYYYSM